MRGPLLSGPVGSAATLGRLCHLLREKAPTVVLSSLWLASALSAEIPVVVLVEPDVRRAARRALQRVRGAGHKLSVLAAAEDVPLRRGAVGALVVERMAEIEDLDAQEFVAGLVPVLRPGGLLVSLDATKDPATEERLAGICLAAALTDIGQERPREGALLTLGRAAAPSVVAARTPRINPVG